MAKDAKRPGTIRSEWAAKRSWLAYLLDVRLNEITQALLNGFIAKRSAKCITPRTLILYIIALRNVCNRAMEDGLLKSLPMENLRPLKVDQVKRPLVMPEKWNNFLGRLTAFR